MQSLLCLLLLVGALLTPLAARAEDPSVAEFAGLDRAGQQRLVRHWLVERFDAAARVALDAPERRRLSSKYDEVLRRIAGGESLTEAGFRSLIEEMGKIEQTAIDQLSLRYRVLVYNRFRTNREEYDRRMAEWRRLIAAWKEGTAKLSDGGLVLDWLARSLQRLQYDEVARLPAPPELTSKTGQVYFPRPSLSETPVQKAGPVHAPARVPPSLPAAAPSGYPLAGGIPAVLPTPRSTPSAPRIAHRVERPVMPRIGPPPREVVRNVPPVIAPPATAYRPEAPVAEPPVMIDLDELDIRIRGYNLALKDLAASLQHADPGTPEQLEHALAVLEDLAVRRVQIALYHDLLSHEDRQLVGSPMSLDASIALLGGKIFAARTQLEQHATANPAPLDRLDRLSRRLASLAAERAP